MAPSPAPEVLRMYTGRFERVREGRKVERVVITLDEKQLRIGYIANGPGAIINGIDITMDGIPRFIIGGVGSDDVQAMAKTRPGDNTVLFTTRNGKITGVTIDKKTYQRAEKDGCDIIRLPQEVRERIWMEALRREPPHDEVVLTVQTGVPMITSDIKVSKKDSRLVKKLTSVFQI